MTSCNALVHTNAKHHPHSEASTHQCKTWNHHFARLILLFSSVAAVEIATEVAISPPSFWAATLVQCASLVDYQKDTFDL